MANKRNAKMSKDQKLAVTKTWHEITKARQTITINEFASTIANNGKVPFFLDYNLMLPFMCVYYNVYIWLNLDLMFPSWIQRLSIHGFM